MICIVLQKPDASEIAAVAASSMPVMNEVPEEDEEGIEELHDRVQGLKQQVLIQQKSIAQARKALNICEASFEFTNSTENIEGERGLLIASELIYFYFFFTIGNSFSKIILIISNFQPKNDVNCCHI